MASVTIAALSRYSDLKEKFVDGLKKVNPGIKADIKIHDTSGIKEEDFHAPKVWNNLLKSIETPYTCMMNDDVYPKSEHWLYGLIYWLEKVKMSYIGPFTNCDRVFNKNALNALSPRILFLSKDIPMTVRSLSGGCAVFRTEQFKSIGGWDENFEFWYDDIDLSFRMEQFGLVGMSYASVVHHPDGATWRRNEKIYDAKKDRGRKYFISKWGDDMLPPEFKS